MRRVAVTGIGVISAVGRGREEFWRSLAQGCPGIGPIEAADRTQLRFQNGAEVRGYDSLEHFEERRA
ncbi:MAG TPA: beta-ketoacyl synthase N-terminal-like domain-containing protein, partial [Longimicrobiaceae bacterium]|nr:beta-ketoacyl synthase N-terminal-like domain-containing protein [Longimicrobiaceae bacterium]